MDWVSLYQGSKTALVDVTGLSKDALHLWLAVLLQLGLAQLFQRRLASLGPLLGVILAETANEWLDFLNYHAVGPDPSAGWSGDTIKDVIGTLTLPLLLFAAARWAPGRLVQPAGTTVQPEAQADNATD